MKRTFNLLMLITLLALTFGAHGVTPVRAVGEVVDQQYDPGLEDWTCRNLTFETLTQDFVPTADNLVALELVSHFLIGATVHVSIRSGSPAGPEIGTVDAALPDSESITWRRFDFASPIPLTPGNTYSIVVTAASGTALICSSIAGGGYPGSSSVDPEDLYFRTYKAGPAVQLSTASINFGSQVVGTTSAAQTVTVTNTGTVNLNIGLLSFTSDWILSNDTCSNATVAPAGTCTFDVAFHPLASGPLTGSVSIPSDAATSPDSVSLSGNGLQPDLVVTKTNNVGGSVVFPNSWDWTVTVTNNGTDDATFASGQTILSDNFPTNANYSWGLEIITNFNGATPTVSMAGSNLSVVANGSFTLHPGGYYSITFNATPTVAGTYANPRAGGSCLADPNNVIAESNESNNTCSDTVTVTAPAVDLSTTSINFGNQPIGVASAPQTVTVTNTGDATLHIGTLGITGDFGLSNDYCSSAIIAPGNSCTFDVIFQPLSIGPKAGTVSIPSDAATSPDSVSLNGNGITPLTATFTSLGAYDGTIFETTETSGVGGAPNISGGFLDAGDMVLDRQVKSLMHFDTSSLPDNAVVTGVTLQLKRYQFVGTDPFTLLGDLNVDIASPYFGPEMAFRQGDFQAAASESYVGTFNPAPLAGNWYEATLDSFAFTLLNLSGPTQFRIHFSLDDNDNLKNDFIRFFSGNSPITAYRPVLIVEYYIP